MGSLWLSKADPWKRPDYELPQKQSTEGSGEQVHLQLAVLGWGALGCPENLKNVMAPSLKAVTSLHLSRKMPPTF